MTSSDAFRTTVTQVVARFARVTPPFSGEAHLYRDLGIESVQALHLLFALEAELGVAIDDQRFIRSSTLDELTRLVAEAR